MVGMKVGIPDVLEPEGFLMHPSSKRISTAVALLAGRMWDYTLLWMFAFGVFLSPLLLGIVFGSRLFDSKGAS